MTFNDTKSNITAALKAILRHSSKTTLKGRQSTGSSMQLPRQTHFEGITLCNK